MSQQEKEAARATRHGILLTGAQLNLVHTGMENINLSPLPTPPNGFLEYQRLDNLASRILWEKARRNRDAEDAMEAVALSLDEMYLVFRGLEAYEQQMLSSKQEALGEVRALIEKLRQEMIRREMALGEVQAALELTPMGKAIMARVPPEQLLW